MTRNEVAGDRGGRERSESRGRGGGDKRNAVIEYGGVWRSARTTRSICMLGDVDHVGRGWPATPGSWLASGHPNATPTPTHAVLNPPRATQPPCTSTAAGGEAGWDRERERERRRESAGMDGVARGGGVCVGRAKRLYLLSPNAVTEFGGIVENWKPPWSPSFAGVYVMGAALRSPSPARAVRSLRNPIKYGTEEIAGGWRGRPGRRAALPGLPDGTHTSRA